MCVCWRACVFVYIYCACITPSLAFEPRNAYSTRLLFFSSLYFTSFPFFLHLLKWLEENLPRCQPKLEPEPEPTTSLWCVIAPCSLLLHSCLVRVNEHREDEMARVSRPGDQKGNRMS